MVISGTIARARATSRGMLIPESLPADRLLNWQGEVIGQWQLAQCSLAFPNNDTSAPSLTPAYQLLFKTSFMNS